jgi:hypothetical protein
MPYRTVELTGTARISRPADLQATVRRIAVRYLGEAAGAAYAEALGAEPMELVRLAGGTLRAWDFSDEFPQA